jgi:hypothetical protein
MAEKAPPPTPTVPAAGGVNPSRNFRFGVPAAGGVNPSPIFRLGVTAGGVVKLFAKSTKKCNFSKCEADAWVGVKGCMTAKCPEHTYKMFNSNISTGLNQMRRVYNNSAAGVGVDEHLSHLHQIYGTVARHIHEVLEVSVNEAEKAYEQTSVEAKKAAAASQIAASKAADTQVEMKAAADAFRAAKMRLVNHHQQAGASGVSLSDAGADDGGASADDGGAGADDGGAGADDAGAGADDAGARRF